MMEGSGSCCAVLCCVGKTLIARQIGKMLATREPKIVNGPEVLNKFVGQSEENIRKLFQDAEEDQKANGDAADLHMIIFDEIDAICVAEGSRVDMGDGTSKLIEAMAVGDDIRAFDGVKGELTTKAVDAVWHQGMKECVEVLLEDGRRLTCTPDHRVLTATGWVEAKDLRLNATAVMCSYQQPLASVAPPQGWTLELSHVGLTLTDLPADSGRVAAFARLLGLLSTRSAVVSGSGGSTQATVHVAHPVDAEAVLSDVQLLTGVRPAVNISNEASACRLGYSITLPTLLANDAVQWGVHSGRKCDDNSAAAQLPHLLEQSHTATEFQAGIRRRSLWWRRLHSLSTATWRLLCSSLRAPAGFVTSGRSAASDGAAVHATGQLRYQPNMGH